jgi:nucleoside-diphosphate-sugar epimerase
MKVLVIGATGYLGSALCEVLIHRGHEVTALVRTPRTLPHGIDQLVGDLWDVDSVRAAAGAGVDAVVHAAVPLGDWTMERRSVQAAMQALGSSAKRFLYLSGVWVLGTSTQPDGSTRAHHEGSPVRPIALMAGREALEDDVLTSNITGIVVRPGVLHGRNGGIPAVMARWAAEEGRGVYVGDDERVSWATVHVEDAARLVVLALERGVPGQVLHAVAEPAVRAAEIAAAAAVSVGARGPVRRRSTKEAAQDLGRPFAEALATSQRVESPRAEELGWRPTRPGILTELRIGSYAETTPPAGIASA